MTMDDSPTVAPTGQSTSNSTPQAGNDEDDDWNESNNENDTSIVEISPRPPLAVPLLQYVLTTCPLNRRFEPMLAGDDGTTTPPLCDANSSVLKATTRTNSNSPEEETAAAAWQCGRALGLRLVDNVMGNEEQPPILETGNLSGWADHFIPPSNTIINSSNNNNNNNSNSSSSVNETGQQEQEQSNVGLAISLWLIPAANNSLNDPNHKNDHQQEPIFTLAIPQSNDTTATTSTTGGCFGRYNLQIAQYQNHFLLRYTDNDAARSCRVLYIQQWDLWSQMSRNASTNSSQPETQEQLLQKHDNTMLTHLVVVLGAGETSIYINGQGIPPLVGLSNDFSTSAESSLSLLSHWSQDLRLQLFGTTAATTRNPPQSPRFAGSIHQVALYNQTLSPVQVDALFRQGLVNVTQMWRNATNNSTDNETLPTLIVDIPKHAVIIPQHVVQEHNQQTSVQVVLSTPNISNTVLQLAMEIASIPNHGQLTETSTEGHYQTMTLPPSPLSVGDLVRLPMGASHVSVEYTFSSLQTCPHKTNNDLGEKAETKYKEEDVCYTFFNEPRFNAYGTDLKNPPESFSYRLVALDADGYPIIVQHQQHRSQEPLAAKDEASAIWASSVVSQPISVQHVNHAPILTKPSQDDLIRMSNLVDDSTRVLFIEGAAVSDPLDFNINRIRVDIWTQGGNTTTSGAGRVALNRQYRHLADFKACSGRTDSEWQCVGGGIDDGGDSNIQQTHRRMTFIAIPDDVNLILHRLQYHYDAAASGRGAAGGQEEEDVVQIGLAMYDGQGGDCLSANEHARWDERVGNTVPTLHDLGCVKVEALIQVPVLAAAGYDDSGNGVKDDATGGGFFNTDLDSFGLADLLFWSFVILILCVMCCCIERLRHCLARGTPIGNLDADSDDNHNGSDDSSRSSIDTGHTKRVCNHCTCKAQDIL
jgi:hypothetical protein